MINVNLFRVWSGGLHDILEAIWAAKFESCSGLIQPQIFENICPPDAKVPTKVHYECQNEMWAAELMRPERDALFTEFDILPVDPTWGLDLMNQTGAAVVASEHIKPNFHYSRWKRTPITGPWWMLFDKRAIVEAGLQLTFKPFDNGSLTTLEDPAAVHAWGTDELAPAACVDAALEWAAGCTGVKAMCDMYVDQVIALCMGSADRTNYCVAIADQTSTRFGAEDCRLRGVQRYVLRGVRQGVRGDRVVLQRRAQSRRRGRPVGRPLPQWPARAVHGGVIRYCSRACQRGD